MPVLHLSDGWSRGVQLPHRAPWVHAQRPPTPLASPMAAKSLASSPPAADARAATKQLSGHGAPHAPAPRPAAPTLRWQRIRGQRTHRRRRGPLPPHRCCLPSGAHHRGAPDRALCDPRAVGTPGWGGRKSCPDCAGEGRGIAVIPPLGLGPRPIDHQKRYMLDDGRSLLAVQIVDRRLAEPPRCIYGPTGQGAQKEGERAGRLPLPHRQQWLHRHPKPVNRKPETAAGTPAAEGADPCSNAGSSPRQAPRRALGQRSRDVGILPEGGARRRRPGGVRVGCRLRLCQKVMARLCPCYSSL